MIQLKNTFSSLRIIIIIIMKGLIFPVLLQAQQIDLVSEKISDGAFSLTNCIVVYDDADFTVIDLGRLKRKLCWARH